MWILWKMWINELLIIAKSEKHSIFAQIKQGTYPQGIKKYPQVKKKNSSFRPVDNVDN